MSLVTSAILTATVTGHNGSGAISVPGLKAGDKLIWHAIMNSPPNWEEPGSVLEPIVTVDDEIQQLVAPDYSAVDFQLILVRQG